MSSTSIDQRCSRINEVSTSTPVSFCRASELRDMSRPSVGMSIPYVSQLFFELIQFLGLMCSQTVSLPEEHFKVNITIRINLLNASLHFPRQHATITSEIEIIFFFSISVTTLYVFSNK